MTATFAEMQWAGNETPPAGPAAYTDSHMFGSTLYEPVGYRSSERSRLELILDGIPPTEREAVRRRNGLSPNGPWEDVYVVTSDDIEADITDFEKSLYKLVRMEHSSEEEEGRVYRVPRVSYIRDTIRECLQPMHNRTPEVYDIQRMAFYGSDERARLKQRISSLLAALYACQTLSMDSMQLRAYLDSERKTSYQLERTRVFVNMVELYKNSFAREAKK